MAHLTAAAVSGGIDTWMESFANHADPSVLQIDACMVLHAGLVGPRQRHRPPHRIIAGVNRRTLVEVCRGIDVLLVSDPGARPRQIARWIRHAGVPTVIFIAHGEGSYTQSRLTQMHAVCDHVVCVSDHVRQRLTIQTPCTVIPNGVDTRTCVATKPSRETRSQLGFDDDDFVVGFVGRFSDEKNPGAVIDSLQHLPPNMKALMVGYGDEDLLQLRADQIGVADRVRWIDGQHFRPIGEAYAAMDALVMPSREEGFGLVALEAMFAGVPVIATRRGVAADWIEQGQNGWLIDDDGTSETVAIEISKRITHLQQRPKRKLRMISKARKTADEMGHASTMMRKYEALLQSCVAAHASFYP